MHPHGHDTPHTDEHDAPPAAPGVSVRPARHDDLVAMEAITADSYHRVDVANHPRSWAAPAPRETARSQAWIQRTAAALASDPQGCWVAESDGRVVGCAISRIREGMWILSSFAVAAEVQGRGIGRALLEVAQSYGRGCLRGMFASSADPAAVRRYRAAGFDLHPQMLLRGVLDRDALPPPDRVLEAHGIPRDLLDSTDRAARGSARGEDHDLLAAQFRLLVRDDTSGSGYAYVGESGPALIAATTRRAATALLWASLATTTPGAQVQVAHVTAANQWALDVAVAARLSVHTQGYLCVRHMLPPTHYIHHGSLL